jgi:hypothetical protein
MVVHLLDIAVIAAIDEPVDVMPGAICLKP